MRFWGLCDATGLSPDRCDYLSQRSLLSRLTRAVSVYGVAASCRRREARCGSCIENPRAHGTSSCIFPCTCTWTGRRNVMWCGVMGCQVKTMGCRCVGKVFLRTVQYLLSQASRGWMDGLEGGAGTPLFVGSSWGVAWPPTRRSSGFSVLCGAVAAGVEEGV